jgi:hypothetical protein
MCVRERERGKGRGGERRGVGEERGEGRESWKLQGRILIPAIKIVFYVLVSYNY